MRRCKKFIIKVYGYKIYLPKNMASILMNSILQNRNKHPKKCEDDPWHLRQVIIIRIWLHFYKDDIALGSVQWNEHSGRGWRVGVGMSCQIIAKGSVWNQLLVWICVQERLVDGTVLAAQWSKVKNQAKSIWKSRPWYGFLKPDSLTVKRGTLE